MVMYAISTRCSAIIVNIRLFPLQCRQRVLDLVVLGVLETDVVVDAGRFL